MRHAMFAAAVASIFAPMLMADDGQNVAGGTAVADGTAKPKAPAKGKFTVTLKGGTLGDKSEAFEFGIAREVDAAKEIANRLGLTFDSKENQAKRTAANSTLLKGIKDMYSDRIYQGALKIANEGDGLGAVPDYMIAEAFGVMPDNVKSAELEAMRTIVKADLTPKTKADKPGTDNAIQPTAEGGDANRLPSTADGTPYAAPANG